MGFEGSRRGRDAASATDAEVVGKGAKTAGRAPGKTTLSEKLPSGPGWLAANVETPAIELPFRSELERAFGRSLSGIRVHVDESRVVRLLGGLAAADGDTIAFAEATPSKATVAHEVTHVLQQRGGTGGTRGGAEAAAENVEQRIAAGLPAGDIGSAGAGVHLKDENSGPPAQLTAKEFLASLGSVEVIVMHAFVLWHGQVAAGHPFAAYFPDPVALGDGLFEAGSPAHPLVDNIEKYILPDKLEKIVNDARRTDDPSHMTGPAHAAYIESVGFALATPMIRNFRQSLTRMVPRYVNAAQVTVTGGDKGKPKTATMGNAPMASDLVPSHPIDRLTAWMLCSQQGKLIKAEQFAIDRPELVQSGQNQSRAVTVRFPVEKNLWHWVEVNPADATAEEVSQALFGVPENAYRLSPMGNMFGFRASDVELFVPDKRKELDGLAAQHHPNAAVTNSSEIYQYDADKEAKWKAEHPGGGSGYGGDPMDAGVPIPAGVPEQMPTGFDPNRPSEKKAYPTYDDTDPAAELAKEMGDGFAADRAGKTGGVQEHDEKEILDRVKDAVAMVNIIEEAFPALGQPTSTIQVLRDQLARRKQASTNACPQNPDGVFALTVKQVGQLGRLAKAATDTTTQVLMMSGVAKTGDGVLPSLMDLDGPSRGPLLEAAHAIVEAMSAMPLPELAEPRVANAEKLARMLRISLAEANIRAAQPTLAAAIDSPEDRHKNGADYDPQKLSGEGDTLLAELLVRRLQLEDSPGTAEQGVVETTGRAGDFLVETSLVANLEALDAYWKLIKDEHDFWESLPDNFKGRGLQDKNRALYGEFAKIHKDFTTARDNKKEDDKKKAREAFAALCNRADFGDHFKLVKEHLEDEASHKKWAKIIVAIAITIAASAVGQWYFGAILLEAGAAATAGTVVAAAVETAVVETAINATLSKIILDQDPTAGSLITGFLGSAAMYGFLGKTMLATRAAGVGGEATASAVKATTTAGKVGNFAKALGKEALIGEAIGLAMGEAQSMIDNKRPMTQEELRESLVHNLAGVIGMKIGNHMIEPIFDPMKPMKQFMSGHHVDVPALMKEQQELAAFAKKVADSKDPKLAQELVTREKAFVERVNEAQQKMLEWAKKNPQKVSKANLTDLEHMGEQVATTGADSAGALMSLEQVGPGLYRADAAAFDAIVAGHKESGDRLVGVHTDPDTGVRTLEIVTKTGEKISVKEKLATPKDRKAPAIAAERATAFEQWLQQQALTMKPEQMQRLREMYATDPAGALKAAERFGFAAESVPDGVAKPTAAEPADVGKAYEHYKREVNADAAAKQQSTGNEPAVMNRSDFERLYKAGFEYDPVTRSWRNAAGEVLPGKTTTGKTGESKPLEPTSSNNQVVGDVHSLAVGEEVLRMLAAGDGHALRVAGVEPPKDFDPRANEWGLGRRKETGEVVLIRGANGEVDWSLMPDIEPLAHSHPIKDPVTGQSRALAGKNGNATINVSTKQTLNATATHSDLVWFLPSFGDLRFVALGGASHKVMTPFAHLGEGMVGNPTVGMDHPTVDIQITSASVAGKMGELVVYRGEVKVFAGDMLLGSYEVYQSYHSQVGDLPMFEPPAGMKALKDLPASDPLVAGTKTPTASHNPVGHFEGQALTQLAALNVDLSVGSATHKYLSELSPHDAGIVAAASQYAIEGRLVPFDVWMAASAKRKGALVELQNAQRELAKDGSLMIKVEPDGSMRYPEKPAAPRTQGDPAVLTDRVKATVAGEDPAAFQWTWSDADTKRVIEEGHKLGLSDDELHDQIRIAQRRDQEHKDPKSGEVVVKKKAITPDEMIQQLNNYIKARDRGFPFGFNTKEEYDAFAGEVKAAVAKAGLPTDRVKIQGSAWRKEQPPDFDLAVIIDDRAFNAELVKTFNGKVTKNGTNVPLTLDNIGSVAADVVANRKDYTNPADTMRYAFENRTIRNQDVAGLRASRKVLEGKYGDLDLTIMSDKGYLNRHFSVLLP